jgi:hypothetical protein
MIAVDLIGREHPAIVCEMPLFPAEALSVPPGLSGNVAQLVHFELPRAAKL